MRKPVSRFEQSEKRRLLRERAIDHLGGSCCICGYNACAEGMDFHHLDPLEKDFQISAKMTSWRAIVRELDKCALLCCRCHRETHAGYHPSYMTDTDLYRSGY